MIVCVNKPDNSVCFVVKEVEEVDNYLFLPDQMYFTEMEPIDGSYDTMDYVDYVIVDGNWVHFDEIDTETLGQGEPPELKVT